MPFRFMSGLRADAFEAIAAVEHARGPVDVVEIPVDGRGHALLEARRRRPAEFGADLGRVDRVAAVVARAVADERDLRLARLPVGARAALVEQRADRPHDGDVLALGIAADVVRLADA